MSILLNKTSLVLLAYMLVHHPNSLRNHHGWSWRLPNHMDSSCNFSTCLAHHLSCHCQWPLKLGCLRSSMLELSTSSSTQSHQFLRWDKCLWWRDPLTISKFKCGFDTICHEAKCFIVLEHLVTLKKIGHSITLEWPYHVGMTINCSYYLK